MLCFFFFFFFFFLFFFKTPTTFFFYLLLFIFKVHFGLSHQLANSLMTQEKELHLVFFFTYFFVLSPWSPSHFCLPLLLVTFLVCMSMCLSDWWCRSDFWVEYSRCYKWRIWNEWLSLPLCWLKLRLIHFAVGLSSTERGPERDCIDISQVGFTKVKTHGTKNTWVCFIGKHSASFCLRFMRETNCISYAKLSQIPGSMPIFSRKAGLLTCSRNQLHDDSFAFKNSSKSHNWGPLSR